MVVSAPHLLATRANLRAAHEKEHDRQLWEGKKNLFREKPRRRKLRSLALRR
jgi:hypothetical protein